jgi:triosephosphate isomerase
VARLISPLDLSALADELAAAMLLRGGAAEAAASPADDAAAAVRIQYGGSMKPDNASELLGMPNIDGGLIGGASLKAGDFAAIVAAAK